MYILEQDGDNDRYYACVGIRQIWEIATPLS